MAERKQDLVSKLADRGEQLVGRIGDLPGAKTLVDQVAASAKRLDDVQRRLRSLDPLEKRVTAIERRLDKLEGETKAARPKARRTTAAKPATGSRSTPKGTTRRTTRRSPRRGGGTSST
jgi:hypothetical protein